MESIPYVSKTINSFDKISYKLYECSKVFRLLELFKTIPQEVIDLLSDPQMKDLSDMALDVMTSYSDKLLAKLSKIKSLLYKQRSKNYPVEESYAGFVVDERPLTLPELISIYKNNKTNRPNSFEYINNQFKQSMGRDIAPVKRKKDIKYIGNCLFCNAPNEYLYNISTDNQYKCKVCKNCFSVKTNFYDELGYYCPNCYSKLEVHKERTGYLIYRCRNNKCPYYLDSLMKKKEKEKSGLATSDSDKLRYKYRSFKFDFGEINGVDKLQFNTKINLKNAHHSPEVIGLALSFYVNFGCSSRKTSQILKQVFNIKISHQTIMNYAEAAASIVQNFTINYPYELGNVLCGDETYIKVRGKNKYVFFFSDPKSKIITSWRIYDHRDTKNAVESILMSLHRYHNDIPKDLLIVTDANPIYNAAQVFLNMHDIYFDLQQVVGVSNKDEVSKEYRPIKQIEERLNRTYKQNYHGTNGYHSLNSANVYMILYVTFFNFLRNHSSLGYKPPVELDLWDEDTTVQNKWITLINHSAKCL